MIPMNAQAKINRWIYPDRTPGGHLDHRILVGMLLPAVQRFRELTRKRNLSRVFN